jgi:hypothetical protein
MKILLKLNGGTYRNVDMDYCVDLWKRLTYEISRVAHYPIDMVLDLMMDWN